MSVTENTTVSDSGAGSRKRILVVDDESNVRESLRLILNRQYEVQTADSGEVALESLKAGTIADAAGERRGESTELVLPDLVLLDLMLPGITGLETLEKLRSDYPTLPVIMLTANTGVKTAVQAMKVGAVDYLNKPYDVDELLSLVGETISSGSSNRSAPSEVIFSRHVRGKLAQLPGDFGCMVGKHPLMQELYRKIEQLAVRDTTVLVTGESGTGKELVAREIHQRSPRKDGPFIALNCAAIPETLIESELFGHEKGAFTHAVEQRIGHFELANGGTLFLDEIGELSLPVQVKMLRFLQEQEFYRVGRSKPIKVDVRVVAATNKSLENAIKEGRFRQDLFYRINVVTLDIPPLRERLEDIPQLLDFFIGRMSPIYGGRVPEIGAEALEVFFNYPWPGNVRELENVTESILALSSTDTITPAELPHRIMQGVIGSDQNGRAAIPFEEAGKAFETELIIKALKKAEYVQTRAAELLGISRRILKYKMDKLGISDKPQQDNH